MSALAQAVVHGTAAHVRLTTATRKRVPIIHIHVRMRIRTRAARVRFLAPVCRAVNSPLALRHAAEVVRLRTAGDVVMRLYRRITALKANLAMRPRLATAVRQREDLLLCVCHRHRASRSLIRSNTTRYLTVNRIAGRRSAPRVRTHSTLLEFLQSRTLALHGRERAL